MLGIAIATVNRPVVCARGILAPAAGEPEQAAPASGATITIYDSSTNTNGLKQKNGIPFLRLVLTIFSSHDSAASGVVFQGSQDGTNPHNISTQSYTAASGETTFDLLVRSPHVKITYQNSANTLTSWEMSLLGIFDRAIGT